MSTVNSKSVGVILFSGAALLSMSHVLSLRHWMCRRHSRSQKDNRYVEESNMRPFVRGGKVGLFLSHLEASTSNCIVWKQVKSEDWRSDADEDGLNLACELEVVNEIDEPVLLCWVDEKGHLGSRRRINDLSIRDGSVSNIHVEYTYAGHSFVCIRERSTSALPETMQEVSLESLVFVYTPAFFVKNFRRTITLKLIESQQSIWCRGQKHLSSLNITLKHTEVSEDEEELIKDPLEKVYRIHQIHGFTVHIEDGLEEVLPEFLPTMTSDLHMVVQVLPAEACAKLQESTPFWVNESMRYGPVRKPTEGRAMCYHPVGGELWLEKHGMSTFKAGGVEMYCAEDHLSDRHLWGSGGVLVHELSHAYHNKYCRGGYECPDVVEAFSTAMKKGLYDRVRVHGSQGISQDGHVRLCKHYACTNCMEFFAELSVAFLWKKDDVTEYNKWWPFNHKQLSEHDSNTCAVLNKYWNQFETYC